MYNLLVQLKVILRKEIRKSNYNEFCDITSFAINEFSKNNEINSCNDIFNIFLSESEKFLIKPAPEAEKKYLETCKECLTLIPMTKNEKIKIGYTQKFQTICDNANISNKITSEFHERFSVDCIKHGEVLVGYRFALKSGNVNIIQMIFNNEFSKDLSSNEKTLFIARISFELLILKNVSSAYKFLAQNINVRDFKSNEPILNFSFFLILDLEKNLGYIKFKELVFQYENSIDLDPNFRKYLDKISLIHFNKKVYPEKPNFDIMKMVKSLSK